MDFKWFWQYKDCENLTGYYLENNLYVKDFFLIGITDMDTAFGYSLDMIGKLLGIVRRPIVYKRLGFVWNQENWNEELWNTSTIDNDENHPMSDTNFRKLLKIRAKQNLYPRTLNHLLELLDTIIPNLVFIYDASVENVLTLTYINASVNLEEKEILEGGYLLPPQGCKIEVLGV